jgi:hypothetical protein
MIAKCIGDSSRLSKCGEVAVRHIAVDCVEAAVPFIAVGDDFAVGVLL